MTKDIRTRTRSGSMTCDDVDTKKKSRKPTPTPPESSSDEGSEDEEEVWETAEDSDDDEDSEEDDSDYVPPSKKSRSKRRVVDSDDEAGDGEFSTKKEAKDFYKKLFSSMLEAASEEESEEEEEERPKKKSKKSAKKSDDKKKPTKKNAKKRAVVEESDTEDDTEDDEDDRKNNNISIIFSSGVDEIDEEEENIERTLNENDVCDSEDEETFMKENYEKIDLPHPKKSKKNRTKKPEKPVVTADPGVVIEDEYRELIELKKHLSKKLQTNPNSKTLLKASQDCKNSINKLVKKTRTNNAKDYYKLICAEQKSTCEIDYFKKKLSHKEQLRIMDQLKEINGHMHIDKPYRLSLLQSAIPAKYKATVMHKLNAMRSMEPGDTEYHKMKNWIDTFMRVPFNVHRSLSVSMKDGLDVCDQYMKGAKKTLDNCVYGLEEAKVQILQLIGQWITNPDAMGTAIAIYGHPGTGKTSLVKDGISKILGREFAFIALGGAGDSSFLEGHGYTYEGSTWGKILQIIIDSKCMNPVIYFDELDKISDSSRGQEIASVLTHLTDTTQNCMFHDKFFSEIDFDLSKCLFIFSYNDESKVNPILRDRMYRIQTKGYDTKEKVIIAKKYILPKIREQVNFSEGEILIPDDTIQYIIGNPGMTQNEHGVRNLKRCLEIIHTKLNLFRLIRTDDGDEPNILGKDVKLKVEFPFTVTRKDVDILIKNEEDQNQSLLAMYV